MFDGGNWERSADSPRPPQPVCQVARWHTAAVNRQDGRGHSVFLRVTLWGEEQTTGEDTLTKGHRWIYWNVFSPWVEGITRAAGVEKKPRNVTFFSLLHNVAPVAAGREDAPLGSTGIFMTSSNDAFVLQRRSDQRTSLKWKPREPLNGTYVRTGQRRQQHALRDEITHPTQSLLVRHNYLWPEARLRSQKSKTWFNKQVIRIIWNEVIEFNTYLIYT